MNRSLYALCAASALAFAPAMAMAQVVVTATDNTTGTPLPIPIHESQLNKATDNVTQVYGSTAQNHMTQDVVFTGGTALQSSGTSTGNSMLHITGGQTGSGAGFAFVSDSPNDGATNLYSIIINPTDLFTEMKFALQLTGNGNFSIYYLLNGGSTFINSGYNFSSTNPANTNYLVDITGGTFDAIQVVADTSKSSIFELKQISYIRAPGAIPEPASWAMMLLGFGGIGWAMRRHRTRVSIPQIA